MTTMIPVPGGGAAHTPGPIDDDGRRLGRGTARAPGPIEDDGLLALHPRATTLAWQPTPAQRVQAATLLRDPEAGVPLDYFDPFAPPRERAVHVARVLERAIQAGQLPGVPMQAAAYDQLWAATFGWGPAQPYLDDPATTEINIIGTGIEVHQQGRGRVWLPNQMPSIGFTLSRIQVLASLSRVPLTEQAPEADIPCGFGCRLTASIPPVSQNGVYVAFRRGRPQWWTVDDLLEREMASQGVLELLLALMDAGNSPLFAGRTGAGKTTVQEALLNSLAGQPKVLTIEDNALELRLRPDLPWIHELVAVSGDPQAYGQAIRKALRKSAHWIVPGETRGAEMGAVLSGLQTGHSLATTIHAEWPEQALTQAATFAAAEGAYMFARQPDQAMLAVCSAFDLIVLVEEWPHLGRRLITNVSLVHGAVLTPATGRLTPQVLTLAEAQVQDGRISWVLHGAVVAGQLVWADGATVTPPRIARRLAQAATHVQLTTNYEQTERDRVAEALASGQQALARGDAQRARAHLTAGWQVRHDDQLLPLARAILQTDAALRAAVAAAWTPLWAQLTAALGRAQWAEAQAALRTISADPLLLVVAPPEAGWASIQAQIDAGLAVQAQAAQVLRDGPGLLATGQAGVLRQQVAQLDAERVPPSLKLPLACLRHQLLTTLVQTGHASPQALAAVAAEVAGLRRAESHGGTP